MTVRGLRVGAPLGLAAALVTGLLIAAPAASATASPSVSKLSVTSGPTAGKTRVNLTGRNFTTVTAVKFGQTPGTAIAVHASTSLQVTAPAHVAGVVYVRVTTRSGTSSVVTTERFVFVAPPTMTSLTPNTGNPPGGTRMTIRGANFVHVTAVKFAGLAGRNIVVSSSDVLAVTVPAGIYGTVDVRVVTAYGTSRVTSADHFTVAKGVRSFQYAGTKDPNQSLTATWLPTRVNAPWVVTIHGGSWINGTQANTQNAVNAFYAHGWQVFNLSYRVGLNVTYDQQVQDLRSARDWIRAHAASFHLNPNRGTAYGFSAGGHLAAVLGLSGGFRTVVSLSGVLRPEQVASDAEASTPAPTPTVNLYERERVMMGCDYVSVDTSDDCALRWRAFSPEFAIKSGAPAFYIVEGTLDTVVPPSSAVSFGAALAKYGVPHLVTMAAGYGHTDQEVFDSAAKQASMLRYVLAHSS
ncbi:MAG: IPT/TIG domain-containing protein [Jatrophihabitantaceae bacterium]